MLVDLITESAIFDHSHESGDRREVNIHFLVFCPYSSKCFDTGRRLTPGFGPLMQIQIPRIRSWSQVMSSVLGGRTIVASPTFRRV